MKTRLKPTDVPERVIAQYAKMLGFDAVDVVDGLVVRGDNILRRVDDGWAWVWSRGDEEDYELDELEV